MLMIIFVLILLIQVIDSSNSNDGINSIILPEREAYPQILAHRGACGYVPEHSLPAYQLAMDMMTDYIEPDLCLSKDGIFVALHDLLLDDVTNVADIKKFEHRKKTKVVEGETMTGYFVNDFLYSELLELRLNQRLSYRTTLYNGKFQIPSLDEIMELAFNHYNNTNRLVGIYVELKHPSYFLELGFNMANMLLDSLKRGGYAINGDNTYNNMTNVIPCIIECFDANTLIYLHEKTSLPLIQLLEAPNTTDDRNNYWTDERLKVIASYAQGIGPEKTFFVSQPLITSRDAVKRAHNFGLKIHPWTFREDNGIGTMFDNNFQQELDYYYCCLGIDALFSEFPDVNREVIQRNKILGTCSYDCSAKSYN